MSIKSSAFGGAILTDNDAIKFVNQLLKGRNNARANEAIKSGQAMAKSFSRDGRVTFVVKNGKLEHTSK